ncbi:WD repeat-containing protein 7-like isoform X2 [Liolophura sinensis]|uniref:WD repeat-containing protein 7-like isoform X2 n=1 Tax=Liolophura sinensis TaxID=3198878 RepID=UPI0031591839
MQDDRIYDASDFTLLCSESNRCGQRWAGGDFISVDRVIVWSTDGRGYLYKLPTNGTSKPKFATAGSTEYHHHNPLTSAPHAYYVLDVYTEKPLECTPAMTYHLGTRDNHTRLLLRGDSAGQIVMWKLPEVSERQMKLVRQESFDRLPVLKPKGQAMLQTIWKNVHQQQPPAGIIDKLCDVNGKSLEVTATIYIPIQGKLVCGREDGTIIVAPATQCIIYQLLDKKDLRPEDISIMTLNGHDGKVTCLLYPFNESTRYEPHHMVSGGVDFSVCLWDIYTGTKLYTFCVHGGEITQLLVPPNNCNTRILSCIGSVASDHSVTLLSLKERKCILLAGRHLFPVRTIKWRPLDDFMVVGCTDGTVYVWQMETGHLDRVVHGITAEEILNNCDENAQPMENLTNPTISLTQALKRRNFATFQNLAKQKLHAQQAASQQQHGPKSELVKPQAYPMFVQGVRTNTKNPDAHVVFFDTEALIVQLLSEEYALMSPGELEALGILPVQGERQATSASTDTMDTQAKLAGFITKVKDKAENVGQKIQAKIEASDLMPGVSELGVQQGSGEVKTCPENENSPAPQRPSTMMVPAFSLTMEIAQLLMSCLHAWGLDPDLDKLCIGKLGLVKPKCPISFGLLSRQGHMSLMLPGWHKRLCKEEFAASMPKQVTAAPPGGKMTLIQQTRKGSLGNIEPMTLSTLSSGKRSMDMSAEAQEPGKQPRRGSLQGGITSPQSAKAFQPYERRQSFQEVMKIFSTKSRWQISTAVTTQHLLSVISVANTLMTMNHASFIDSWRLVKKYIGQKVSSSHGMMVKEIPDNTLTDDSDGLAIQQAQIKQGWSLLAALHCVLLPELVGASHYQGPQLEMLARRWQDRCLEIREAAQALLLAELRRIGPEGRKAVVDEWSPSLPTYVAKHLSLFGDPPGHRGEQDDEEIDEEDDNVLGAESPVHRVSQSYESRRRQATAIVMLGVVGAEFGHEIEPSKRKVEESKKKKAVQDGFGLANYSLARHTSKALTFLLLESPSRRLPAYTPIRRAAIDLLGRGFTVWEPYLDVSAVLLGLLELCVNADRLVPSMTYGLPLSPAADSCRTARHALSLIATARPPAFIITMAKEVARHNALAQNAQTQHINLHASVLVRAKQEILRVVELLVDKMPNDVADLLVETMDIIVHCLDIGQLRVKGLHELFPSICRFSVVAYCSSSRRICVGARNGGVAFYELKQHSKCQVIPAHKGAVIAVSFSPDGKYLASYSHVDSKLKFWQTGSSSLFGIGSQQTKCVKTSNTPPLTVNPLTNLLKMVRLVWVDNRTMVLLTVDGKETKYSV